jgi:hypothetical protein
MTTFTTEDREQAYKSTPLTDKQIMDIYYDMIRAKKFQNKDWQLEFARLIEKAHGISWT